METKNCSNCGSNVELNSKFCPNCGSTEFFGGLQTESTPTKPPSQEKCVQQPVAQESTITPSIPNIETADNGEMAITPKKHLKWWHIALIAISVVLVVSIVFAIFSNSNQSGKTKSIYPSPNAKAKLSKTIMIYMVGSNLETLSSAASKDILEMFDSGVNTENNNILIYTGGCKDWTLNIPSNYNVIYSLENGDFVPVKSYSALNMGVSSTLTDFINYGMSSYYADEYGLILWDHGGGPMVGYGADELYNYDVLEMSELSKALSDSILDEDNKLEFIGFDACLMGSIEIAWRLKDYANYLIASQETEPGCGWDYSFLEQLDHYDSGCDIGSAIVDYYIDGCEELADLYPQMESDVTLSCMDLSKIDEVEKNLNALFEKVDKNLLSGYFSKVSKYRNKTKSFGKFSTTFDYDLIDLGHLTTMLSADYASEANKLKKSINNFVCYSKSNVSNATGVSIYHPYDNKEYMSKWINSFKSLGFASNYAQYLTDFSSEFINSNSSSWKSFGKTQGTAVGNSDNNDKELSMQLTPEQVENYSSSKYYVIEKTGDNTYKYVYCGIDSELDSNGVLRGTYENKAVFLVDDTTTEVSDSPITMNQVAEDDGEYKYQAPSMFIDDFFNTENKNPKADSVLWQIKITDGVPKTLGAILNERETGDEIPQKQLLDYKDYDYTQFLTLVYTAKYDDQGTLLPFNEWDYTGKLEGFSVDSDDDFHLECRDIGKSDKYFVMFVVTDIQGNQYGSQLFPLVE